MDFDGVNYLNCGDWVESCTALAENYDGTFEIIYWDKIRKDYVNVDEDEMISSNRVEDDQLKKAS